MNSEKKKVIIFEVLLFVVFVIIVLLLFIISIKNANAKTSIIQEIVENTSWPIEEVPMIANKNVTIEIDSEIRNEGIAKSGVSYEEFRAYLVELYEQGYKPVEDFFDSQNPNFLVTSLDGTEVTAISWMGENEEYQVNVSWAELGAISTTGEPYDYNFKVSVYTKSELQN